MYEYFSSLNPLVEIAVTERDVPPEVRAAFRLMHNVRIKMIKKSKGYVLVDPFSGSGASCGPTAGRDRALAIDGLTKELEILFYPDSHSKPTGGARTGGASRGNTVDSEIEKLVNHGIAPTDAVNPYTIKTLQYLKDHNLQPFAAQVMVFDEKIRIATALDLLCINLACKDVSRNIVNVQLKTGFDLNYEAADSFLRSPFVQDSTICTITDSHKNKHQLQALVEHIILAKNYGSGISETCILVISERVHSMYKLEKHIRALAPDVYRNLHARLAARKTNRHYAFNLKQEAQHATYAASQAKSLFSS